MGACTRHGMTLGLILRPLCERYEVGSLKSKVRSKVGSGECLRALPVRCASDTK